MGLFDSFKKKPPTHEEKVALAYRCYKPDKVETIFPGKKEQADKIIISLAKICNISLNACDAQRYYRILTIYSDVLIRKVLTHSSDEHIVTSLLMKHSEEIKDRTIALQAVVFVTLNMANNSFAIYSEDDKKILLAETESVEYFMDARQQNKTVEQENLNDANYGLTGSKPIYTNGVEGSRDYLSKLRTSLGESVTWERTASYDIEDQYEIRMQNLIEEAAEEIYAHIERIKKLTNTEGIKTSLSGLIRRVKNWDRLVQPLQLKTMSSGILHSGSMEMGQEIHDFSVWLHNEKELSQVSLEFIKSIKPMFAELREIYDVFESDCVTLSNIIKSDKDAEQIVLEIDLLKASANSIKIYPSSSKVDEFIFKIKAVNKKVKQISLEHDLVEQVRENICYIARDVAITLHNEKAQTDLALKIVNVLLAEFSDLSELKSRLSQDVATLNRQVLEKARIRQQQEAKEQAAKARGIGCLVWVGIILLICLIGGGLSRCDSSSNNSSSQNSSNYSYSSDAETYTVTLNKQNGTGGTSSVTVKKGRSMPSATAPTRSGYTFKGYYSGTNGSGTKYYNANMTSARSWDKSSGGTLYAYWEKKEASKFTSSASVGESVYVDITSIFPEIGIYTEGSGYYSEFVCRCTTSSGSTVWINMTCSEYKSYFDSDASTSIFNSYADEITFSSSKRIYGVVKKCDSVLSGLSADTGTTLLIDFKSVN